MAVIQDPQGAFFMVWEPRANIGAELVNGPGALVWNELATTDLDAGAGVLPRPVRLGDAREFEGAPETLPVDHERRAQQRRRCRDVMPPGAPPHWLVYFGVAGHRRGGRPGRGARRQRDDRADRHPAGEDRDRRPIRRARCSRCTRGRWRTRRCGRSGLSPPERKKAASGGGLLDGASRARTVDLLHAMQALSQLSYSPELVVAGHLNTPTLVVSAGRSRSVHHGWPAISAIGRQ